MLCSRCECSFYLARSVLSYTTTLLSGCLVMCCSSCKVTILKWMQIHKFTSYLH